MDKIGQIKRPIEAEMADFKSLFNESLRSDTPLLDEVLTYIKRRNGKMMRPMLVFLTAKLFGKPTLSTQHAALALELLHTASLVHDDVVDESNERRGQTSVNAIYDNRVSVLVGDYLLAASLKSAAYTKSIILVDLVARLGQELSEGEIIQLANIANNDFSEAVYYDVIRKKTAALFAACAESGALSVGVSKEEAELAYSLGEMIGIAFQIKDDIFDYNEDQNVGKPTGNDMLEGKLTLPALYALNLNKSETMRGIALKVRSLTASKTEISDFIAYIKEVGGITYAEQVMRSYRDKALALLPDSTEASLREALTAFIDYVIDRDK